MSLTGIPYESDLIDSGVYERLRVFYFLTPSAGNKTEIMEIAEITLCRGQKVPSIQQIVELFSLEILLRLTNWI